MKNLRDLIIKCKAKVLNRRYKILQFIIARFYYSGRSECRYSTRNYGVISYTPSLNKLCQCNLGDEFQSIAAQKFMPGIDCYIPRDFPDRIYPPGRKLTAKQIYLIMAARFCRLPERWPPPEYIKPVFTGFRIEPDSDETAAFIENKSLEYFKQNEPIGCRDLDTAEYLNAQGIKTILTGCITLTLNRDEYYDQTLAGKNNILLINLPENVIQMLPSGISCNLERKCQILPKKAPQKQAYRTKKASDRLRELASARLIITTKVHATLPSVAFGTPVVFIDKWKAGNSRLSGMNSLIHYFNRHDPDFKQKLSSFPFDNPPPNPDPALHRILVARTRSIITAKLNSESE